MNVNLQIAQWGNSLALRIPAELVRRLDLHPGDQLQASLNVDGSLCIRTGVWDRKAFASELQAAHAQMPESDAVIDELRREARY